MSPTEFEIVDMTTHHGLGTGQIPPPAVDAKPVYDPAAIAELEGVFGRSRLTDLIGRLKDEIARRLQSPDADRAIIGQDAHTLLSVSGSLGFIALSASCGDLERACLYGEDLAAPLQAARLAAADAIAAIVAMESGVPLVLLPTGNSQAGSPPDAFIVVGAP